MNFNNLLYNLILYNRSVKKITIFLLKSSVVNQNPIYNYFYQKTIQNKISRYSTLPFRVMVENTNICNADCVFCPHRTMKRKVGTMDMVLFKKIVDQCKKFNINYLTIYGFGEPLLDRKFIEKVKYAKKIGIERVTTNTNAMYLDKVKIKQILESGIDEIYISFDALTAATYKKIRPGLDFAIVNKNILNLINLRNRKKSKKPEIVLSFVESSQNNKETDGYIKKWKNIVDFISISQIHNWTGDIQNGTHKGRRDPCRLLWTDMVISFDGKVPLCCNDYENKIIIGDVNKNNIQEIWGGKIITKTRQEHLKNNFNNILCQNCQYNYHWKSPWWVSK